MFTFSKSKLFINQKLYICCLRFHRIKLFEQYSLIQQWKITCCIVKDSFLYFYKIIIGYKPFARLCHLLNALISKYRAQSPKFKVLFKHHENFQLDLQISNPKNPYGFFLFGQYLSTSIPSGNQKRTQKSIQIMCLVIYTK